MDLRRITFPAGAADGAGPGVLAAAVNLPGLTASSYESGIGGLAIET